MIHVNTINMREEKKIDTAPECTHIILIRLYFTQLFEQTCICENIIYGILHIVIFRVGFRHTGALSYVKIKSLKPTCDH